MNQITEGLTKQIAYSVVSCDGIELIQPLQVGLGSWQNELLLFIKPELLMADHSTPRENAIDLVFQKLKEFDAYSDGIIIVGGKVLEEKGIMDQHYGFINRLSRFASKMLSQEEIQKVYEALDLPPSAGYEILGGHEYLARYTKEDIHSLDRLWFTKKSIKLRSGFYIQWYEKDGDKFILVNGFHPAQLAHFTDPSHRIVLFLVHSNAEWRILKNQMVGATFPEKADPKSMRGVLYSCPHEFGLETVSIANNGVHLSAGPFEAVFEIVNFLGKISGLDLEKTPALALRKMVNHGVPLEKSLSILKNPQIEIAGKTVDLFTATEDMDTEPAIEYWKKNR